MSSTTSSISTSTSETKPKRSSSKLPVTAEHTLTRVRENQRRHRARRKDYISTLETKLAETEIQLAKAHAEIALLHAERDASSCSTSQTQALNQVHKVSTDDLVETQLQQTNATIQTPTPFPLHSPENKSYSECDGHPFHILSPLSQVLSSSALPMQIQPPPPQDPCCLDDVDITPSQASESTTLCTQAYMLIAQQNYLNVDTPTIRAWLWRGFRRARAQGEGCRVENAQLMGVLDLVSGGGLGEGRAGE